MKTTTDALVEALEACIDAYAVPSTACKERSAYEKAIAALALARAEQAEPVGGGLYIGACITDGILHATVMRHESGGQVTVVATAEIDAERLHTNDALSKMRPAPPAPVPQPVQVEPVTESEMNRSWFLACKEIIDRCVSPDMYANARAMLDKALYESMLAAAPLPPKREPLWQPIETAPKDGTDVIVMYKHIETQVVHNAFYIDDEDACDVGWWSYDKGEVSRVLLDGWMQPTHWMPLPDAPTEAAHGITPKEGG